MAIALQGGKIVSTLLPTPAASKPSTGPYTPTTYNGATGQAVGSSSSSSSSAGKQNGGWYNGTQYWAPGQGPSSPSSASPQSSTPALPNLDDIYAPIFSAYDSAQKSSQDLANQSNATNQQTYDSQLSALPGQQKSLQDSLAGYQTQFTGSVNSAYDQATRDYQAAQQRAIALYGGGNSAGQATNDLATQEYLRNRNGINTQEIAGNQDFDKQGQDIVNWVTQKHSDLDTWLGTAKQQVQSQFNSDLSSINNNRAATTAQKAAQKVQLLSDVMAQNNALQEADNNFRRQLQLVQAQATQIGGSQMDQTGFNNTLNGLYSSLAPYTSGAQQSAAAAGAPQAAQYFTGSPSAKANDQYASIISG